MQRGSYSRDCRFKETTIMNLEAAEFQRSAVRSANIDLLSATRITIRRSKQKAAAWLPFDAGKIISRPLTSSMLKADMNS
jgi:hypothetical protein